MDSSASAKPVTVDEYIAGFPDDVKAVLQEVRATVREAAPDAVEGISYGMPAYSLNKKPVVYFAAFAKHIGFYATPTGHEAFADELSVYKQGKGSVQFPLTGDMPLDLIARITRFRAEAASRL